MKYLGITPYANTRSSAINYTTTIEEWLDNIKYPTMEMQTKVVQARASKYQFVNSKDQKTKTTFDNYT